VAENYSKAEALTLWISSFSYILAAEIDTFAAVREDVLLRMMPAVDEAGAQFAFPSVTHHAASDEDPDPERGRRAVAAVEKWRETEDLPFPDSDWKSKAETSGSLQYPPEGSALTRRLA